MWFPARHCGGGWGNEGFNGNRCKDGRGKRLKKKQEDNRERFGENSEEAISDFSQKVEQKFANQMGRGHCSL